MGEVKGNGEGRYQLMEASHGELCKGLNNGIM